MGLVSKEWLPELRYERMIATRVLEQACCLSSGPEGGKD